MGTKKKSQLIQPKPESPWIYAAILALALLVVSIARLSYPELSHGDEWSDSAVLIAGENFARLGFGSSNWLPFFHPRSEVVPLSNRPDLRGSDEFNAFGVYTRLPPFSYWMNGFFQHFINYDNIIIFRILPVMLSFVSVFALFGLIQTLFQSARFSFICSLLYMLNPYFIANFDSIFELSYMDCFRNLALFFLAKFAMKFNSAFGGAWFLCWMSLFILALTTYEYLPWMTLAVSGVAAFEVYRKRWMEAGITLSLGTGIAAGLLLHFGLVAWHYGSVKEAIADRLANASQRMLGDGKVLGSSGGLDWGVWMEFVALRFPDQVSVVGWGWLFVFIGLGIALPLFLAGRDKTSLQLAFGLGIFFILCAFTWYVIMPAHCIDHAGLSFLQKFLIPGMCLLLAVPIEAAFRILEERKVSVWLRTLCYAPVAVVAMMGVLQSELPVTPQKIAFEREFLKVADCLRKLRPLATAQEFMASNVFRPTWMMMYYVQSRVLFSGSVAQLESLKEKPKVFIYVPVNSPESQELGRYLEQNYRLVSFCDNQRLPFYVMVRP